MQMGPAGKTGVAGKSNKVSRLDHVAGLHFGPVFGKVRVIGKRSVTVPDQNVVRGILVFAIRTTRTRVDLDLGDDPGTSRMDRCSAGHFPVERKLVGAAMAVAPVIAL